MGSNRPQISLLCAFAILTSAASCFANESVYQQVLPATAWIITPSGDSGSGVLVDKGRKLVATSFHVVGRNSEVTVVFPVFNDRKAVVEKDHYQQDLKNLGIKAKVIIRDPIRDLALIELKDVPNGATDLKLASRRTSPGQTIHAIGNPGASEALWVYSTGSIRQTYSKRFVINGQVVEGCVVETQTPINPGDSGGPVVNDAGELVALTCAYRRDSSLFGLCIEASELKDLLLGNVKSIDRHVAESLRALNLKYTISLEGNYVVDIPTKYAPHQVVVVGSLTWPRGSLRVRQVSTVTPVPMSGLSGDTAISLLKRNDVLIFGSWKFVNVDGNEYLVYRTIVPASSEPETLREALIEAIGVTANLGQNLANLEAKRKSRAPDK